MVQRLHYISDVDVAAKTATCRECGPEIPVVARTNPTRWVCLTARRQQRTRRAPRVVTAAQRRQFHLKTRFGLTPAQYDAMVLDQGGACAICERPCGSGRRLAVDHDHATGLVRGLLCGKCNRGIGLFDDGPERLLRAVQYLNRFATA